MQRVFLVGTLLMAAVAGSGCSLAPKNFRSMIHPAPIVRARAVGLGEDKPEWVAVPAMIERLKDSDEVVRMTAHDGLKERTHRDFGYIAWAPVEERNKAVERWRTWWKDRAAQAGFPKPGDSTKVTNRPDRVRRKDLISGGQGGPNGSWPPNSPDQTTQAAPPR